MSGAGYSGAVFLYLVPDRLRGEVANRVIFPWLMQVIVEE